MRTRVCAFLLTGALAMFAVPMQSGARTSPLTGLHGGGRYSDGGNILVDWNALSGGYAWLYGTVPSYVLNFGVVAKIVCAKTYSGLIGRGGLTAPQTWYVAAKATRYTMLIKIQDFGVSSQVATDRFGWVVGSTQNDGYCGARDVPIATLKAGDFISTSDYALPDK